MVLTMSKITQMVFVLSLNQLPTSLMTHQWLSILIAQGKLGSQIQFINSLNSFLFISIVKIGKVHYSLVYRPNLKDIILN